MNEKNWDELMRLDTQLAADRLRNALNNAGKRKTYQRLDKPYGENSQKNYMDEDVSATVQRAFDAEVQDIIDKT